MNSKSRNFYGWVVLVVEVGITRAELWARSNFTADQRYVANSFFGVVRSKGPISYSQAALVKFCSVALQKRLKRLVIRLPKRKPGEHILSGLNQTYFVTDSHYLLLMRNFTVTLPFWLSCFASFEPAVTVRRDASLARP